MAEKTRDDKIRERMMLLARFMRDEDLVEIALELGLTECVAEYRERYEAAKRGDSRFYLPYGERGKLIRVIAKRITDEKLAGIFNRLKPEDRLMDVKCFRGKYYTYYEGREFLLRGSWG